ncbi:hypothetical protein CC80DRAFT_488994 [Byssothecium circinans]|uniref:Uncharacterized protein n=1 Tax=Byssothecium circinans TaxID=147558 RepID=A0A6A5U8R1_9PLEO|nr:hypothetical protein CC80DRAFT_488994 [Byssothecium circinans]
MDVSPKVSSLYGPGAFVGWLCTMASLLISWTFNRYSRARNTIGNDLIATLTYPSIAAIQFQYELWKTTRNSAQPAMEPLDATSCIVVWFLAIGPWLLGLAAGRRGLKRFICTAVVSVPCLSALLTIPARHDLLARLPAANWGILVYIFCNFFCAMVFVLDCEYQDGKCDRNSLREVINTQVSRPRDRYNRPRIYPGTRAYVLPLLTLAIWLLLAVVMFIIATRSPELVEGQKRPISELFSVPRTGYSITELDQIVALSAGLLAVIFSIYEAFISRKLSAWERYQKWRDSCEILLDQGILEEDETSRWKRELQIMDQQKKRILEAPTSTELLPMMERIKEDREEELFRVRWEQMSEEEKKFAIIQSNLLGK